MKRLDDSVKAARRKLVRAVTEVILASAEVLEAEQEKEPWDRLDLQSLYRHRDADPGLIRGFVETPVYEWVTHDYISGADPHHFLCKIVELLHELAPGVFRRPSY